MLKKMNKQMEVNIVLYIGDEIKKYLKFIFYLNKNNPNVLLKMYDAYLKYRIHRLGVRLGFDIPINAVGPGLRIDHFGFVAINGNAKVGKIVIFVEI